MDERVVDLLEGIAASTDALAELVVRVEAIERELARANEQLADIRNALYS